MEIVEHSYPLQLCYLRFKPNKIPSQLSVSQLSYKSFYYCRRRSVHKVATTQFSMFVSNLKRRRKICFTDKSTNYEDLIEIFQTTINNLNKLYSTDIVRTLFNTLNIVRLESKSSNSCFNVGLITIIHFIMSFL